MYNLADKIRFHLISTLDLCDSSTIAYQYINRLNFEDLHTGTWHDFYREDNPVTLPDINFSLIRTIVEERKISITENDAFAIHLRLGDKLDFNRNFRTILHKLINKHALNLKYNLCRIYYGNHNNKNDKESLAFIDALRDFLRGSFLLICI